MKILTHSIDFKRLIRQIVHIHKLQTNRLLWLNGLLSPLVERFTEWRKYRTDVRMMVRVTSQVKIFEGYLQTKYKEPVTIKLVTFDDGALNIGVEAEGETMGANISLIAENSETVSTALLLEIRDNFEGADFILYIPNNLKISDMQAEIERFKQVLVKYKIVQK